MFSLSLVVPATDSWVTFAIRSYKEDGWAWGASTSVSGKDMKGSIVSKQSRYMSDKFIELTFTEVKPSKGKIDDCRILFFHECILCKPFEMEDDVLWEALAFEPSQLTGGLLFTSFNTFKSDRTRVGHLSLLVQFCRHT